MTACLKPQFPKYSRSLMDMLRITEWKTSSTNAHTDTHTHITIGCSIFFFKESIIGWKALRASSGLVDCCLGSCLLSLLRGQGSISSGTMLRMTSSLPRLTTVRRVSSCFMAALTSLAEVIGSPLMLMMTSFSWRPALLPRGEWWGG